MKVAHGTVVRRADGTLWRISVKGFAYPIDTTGKRAEGPRGGHRKVGQEKIAALIPFTTDEETRALSRDRNA